MSSVSVTRHPAGWIQRVSQNAGQPHTLSEIFTGSAIDAGAVGFVLTRIRHRDHAPILWVQDRLSQKEAGRPYLPGLNALRPILRVDVTRAADVLWAMEDGLRCKSLSAVIGEVWGDPPALNFTATKRLALRSEASGTPCWLIRRAASPDLSAARDRWRVTSLPSSPHPDDPKAPGDPRWQVELFRSRRTSPGEWVASYDSTADRVDLSAPFRDGAMAEGDGKDRQRAAR
ncbi:MAG: hypothetical protein WBN04_16065 [Paracoccaceae bacterium]